MCFPCAAGVMTGRGQPPLAGALRKPQAEESPDTAGSGRRREDGADAHPRPGQAPKLIKTFVESY